MIGTNGWNIFKTRRSGRYAPILLAPAESWGALRALLGDFGPSSVGEGSKQSILNLVSKLVKMGQNRSKWGIIGQKYSSPKMVPKRSKIGLKMVPKWYQNYPKTIQVWSKNGSQNSPKMVLKCSRNGPKIVSKYFQNGPKMGQKCAKNGSTIVPK